MAVQFPVSEKKIVALVEEMHFLGISESDIQEKFVKASGSGGQKVNKSNSCVVLTHLTTNISVRCEKERSQGLNRYYARKMLCLKVREHMGLETAKDKKAQKVKKQKDRKARKQRDKTK